MLRFHFSQHTLRPTRTLQAVCCIYVDFKPSQVLYVLSQPHFKDSAALR